jgi:hypothetical protein
VSALTPDLRVVGIDPGPVPGIVELLFAGGALLEVEVVQCSAALSPCLLAAVLQRIPVRTVVQIERFVTGRRASRSSTAAAGATTRDLVGHLSQVVVDHGRASTGAAIEYAQRSAAQVKPWATDERLAAAGLLEACKGMRHARDAARHAAFAAVHDGGVTDPLSRSSRWSV